MIKMIKKIIYVLAWILFFPVMFFWHVPKMWVWATGRSQAVVRQQEVDRAKKDRTESVYGPDHNPEGKREALIEELTDISGVSDKLARTILDQFPFRGSIKWASANDLSKVPGVGESIARAIKARVGEGRDDFKE